MDTRGGAAVLISAFQANAFRPIFRRFTIVWNVMSVTSGPAANLDSRACLHNAYRREEYLGSTEGASVQVLNWTEMPQRGGAWPFDFAAPKAAPRKRKLALRSSRPTHDPGSVRWPEGSQESRASVYFAQTPMYCTDRTAGKSHQQFGINPGSSSEPTAMATPSCPGPGAVQTKFCA